LLLNGIAGVEITGLVRRKHERAEAALEHQRGAAEAAKIKRCRLLS